VLFPLEGDRFIVTFAGWSGKYPASDEDGFTRQLVHLRSPVVAEEVALAEPISKVYSYRQMANRWRHYEKWSARLDGFVALGDAACAFNPVYGQGMTSGAISALILRDCVREYGTNSDELPRRFFERQARFQSEPWAMATGADFRFAGTEGRRPLAARMIDPILGKMFDVQTDDPMISHRLGEVINMMKPPSSLFEREILARIARAWVRRLARRKAGSSLMTAMPPPLSVEPVAA